MPFAAVAFDVCQHDIGLSIRTTPVPRCEVITVPAKRIRELHIRLGVHGFIADKAESLLLCVLLPASAIAQSSHVVSSAWQHTTGTVAGSLSCRAI